jgi:hypothetical protein
LEQFTFPPESLAPGLGTDFHPLIVQAGKVIIGVMWAATLSVVVYLWLVYSLGQFPKAPIGPSNSESS